MQRHPQPIRNIYCIGRNYAEHATELGNPILKEEPIIFLKSTSSLRGLQPSPLAFADETFHYEIEVVILIGEVVPLNTLEGKSDCTSCVDAVGLGLDLTRRGKQSDLKQKGHPWTVAKSFAGSAIVSPMSKVDASIDLDNLEFTLDVNGTQRQKGHVREMTFSMSAQLSFLNRHTALLPGDLLFTGTPKGVGEIRQGDSIEMTFTQGVGSRVRPYAGIL